MQLQETDWYNLICALSEKLEYSNTTTLYPKIAKTNAYVAGILVGFQLVQNKQTGLCTNYTSNYTLTAFFGSGRSYVVFSWKVQPNSVVFIKYVTIKDLEKIIRQSCTEDSELSRVKQRNKELEKQVAHLQEKLNMIGDMLA